MGTEAQKLISLSLEKMATCRRRRREMGLHKNLLLTTVIHKARIAIESRRIAEEAYYMMNTYECDGQGMRPIVTTTYESGQMLYYGGGHQQQPHHYDDDQDVPMDWEGSDGSAPVLSPQSVVIVSTTSISMSSSSSPSSKNIEDKENVCPVIEDDFTSTTTTTTATTTTTTCCEQRFGACRSADCQYLRSGGNSTSSIGVGHKRLMMDILMDSGEGDDDDMVGGDEQKKLKWDAMMDPDSDTSHALRLVSVLSATLSGNSSSGSTMTSSSSSRPPSPPPSPPPPRLVKSISSPDLCSKQAKDAMDGRAVDRPVMAIAV